MTEDAQSAFLKTLEEPPAGTVLILTAADEERLLPTIRSRCVRIRLGPVARRDVEGMLVDGGLADAPLAARLARLSGGRPGEAVALARAPEALMIRSEVGRTLLDLTAATRADRLRIGRDLLAHAALAANCVRSGRTATRSRRRRPRGDRAAGRGDPAGRRKDAAAAGAAARRRADAARARSAGPAARIPASERRAAALVLVAIWRDVARDLALVALGEPGDVRQLELLDDLEAAAAPATGRRSPPRSSIASTSPASGSRATSARSSSSMRSRSAGPRERGRGHSGGPLPAADARLEAVVEGRVQGVGFRVFVLRRARDLGLSAGWPTSRRQRPVRRRGTARRRWRTCSPRFVTGPRGAGVRWRPRDVGGPDRRVLEVRRPLGLAFRGLIAGEARR